MKEEEMFKTGKNYLILGEKNSNKTYLGNNIVEQLKEESYCVNLFNDKQEKPFPDNKNVYLLDDYSTKDNSNQQIKRLIKDKNISVVIISPYFLGLDQVNRCYTDYIFISKIEDENTLRCIYNVHLKHTIKYSQLQELNKNCNMHHFIVIDKSTTGFGYYHPIRGFSTKIINNFYEKVVNLLWS